MIDLCALRLPLRAPFPAAFLAAVFALFDSVVVVPGLAAAAPHLAAWPFRVRFDLMLATRRHYLRYSWVLECILKRILDRFLIRGAV